MWIHSETRTSLDKNIQSENILFGEASHKAVGERFGLGAETEWVEESMEYVYQRLKVNLSKFEISNWHIFLFREDFIVPSSFFDYGMIFLVLKRTVK